MSQLGELLFALLSAACIAQASEQLSGCLQGAKTQTEMAACANEEAKRVDAELKDVYRKLLSAAASKPKAVEKIAPAEKACLAYRDAYSAATSPDHNKQAPYP